MTLLEQCQIWHENEEFQKIIAELEAIPAEERTPELDSELARAYNNAADTGDRAYFEKAIELLTPHADYFHGDHLWNYRMGYAYYHLGQERRALPYFEAALAALPGDADTMQMIAACQKHLSTPNAARKPLLSPTAIRKLEAMDDGGTGYFYKMLYYLEAYIKNGMIKGNFTREEAHADLDIALWYAYACNNLDDYEYYYRTMQWMPASEVNARGCGTWYYRYAVALMYCGRLDDALRAVEKGAQEEPDYPWTYLQLGKLRAHFGDRAGALDAVQKGLSLVPDDHEFLTLAREIKAGATIEQMSYHWIDPAFDEELQEASAEENLGMRDGVDADGERGDKQRAIACMTMNEAGLSYFKQLFRPDPQDYERDAPFCSFRYTVKGTPVKLVFRMNEAGLSKRDPAWLRTQKERLDDGRWLKRVSGEGTGVLTAVHYELDNQVTLAYQYPWQEKNVYIPLDEDGNPAEE